MYPELTSDGESTFYGPSDYAPLVSAIGAILVESTDNDYRGYSRFLLRGEDGRVGVMLFGWGSCSGCDALQACDTYAEIDKLAVELSAGVKWFANGVEAIAYLKSKDWEGTTQYQDDDASGAFVESCEKAVSL